jgi:hypothetical protein
MLLDLNAEDDIMASHLSRIAAPINGRLIWLG